MERSANTQDAAAFQNTTLEIGGLTCIGLSLQRVPGEVLELR